VKIAIVHDCIIEKGGAENVLLKLVEIFPKADLYTSIINPNCEIYLELRSKIKTSFIVSKLASKYASIFKPLINLYWQALDLSKYDLVISSSGSFSAKHVRTPAKTLHLCYCYTPPHYLYSEYSEMSETWPILSGFRRALYSILRRWDYTAGQRPDVIIAISKTIQKRISKYYKRRSIVIYPPVILPNKLYGSKRREDYYLYIGRIYGQKGLDLLIQAFNKTGKRLVIAGTGARLPQLKLRAKPNIIFKGYIDEKTKEKLLAKARGFIYPSVEEDFGIAPVEAMSYGTPVIAFYSGGLRESIIEGKTGVFFKKRTVLAITKAVQKFESLQFNPAYCRKQAKMFSEKVFETSLVRLINKNLEKGIKKRIMLFGKVPFDLITQTELVTKVIEWAQNGVKKLALNMNAYGAVTFLKNKRYAKIINSADLIYADGWGPVFASKIQTPNLPERVNVGDFIDKILALLHRKKLKLFLLGSKDIVIAETVRKIKSKYKNVKIVGFHHGFFSRKDQGEIALKIKKTKPNLVLVGMGLPIQEYFIHDNWKKLPNAVYMGVGGVFEYIAGKNRAPIWMRKNGFEWFFRFIQEPRRLWKRYTLKNLEFVYYFLKSLRISDSKNPGSS
jgi:exopolysaccharide biosynthesis WecB/TagA/CpsF family protein